MLKLVKLLAQHPFVYDKRPDIKVLAELADYIKATWPQINDQTKIQYEDFTFEGFVIMNTATTECSWEEVVKEPRWAKTYGFGFPIFNPGVRRKKTWVERTIRQHGVKVENKKIKVHIIGYSSTYPTNFFFHAPFAYDPVTDTLYTLPGVDQCTRIKT